LKNDEINIDELYPWGGDFTSGDFQNNVALISLNNRIIDAPGAIPYIENLNKKAITRFQQQIEIIDLIDVIDEDIINESIKKLLDTQTESFGKPFIAIQMVKESKQSIDDTRALHSKIKINYLGKIEKRK